MWSLYIPVCLVTTILAVPGDRQCEWGKYGQHCNLTCPVNCALFQSSNLQHCDRDTGKCSEGCRRGWHGDLCNQSCSTNCLNKTCNLQTGHCTRGCTGTSMGVFCNSTRKCGRGWYGDTCEHPCSSNCVEERCNQTTGVCILGCNGTYTGEFCNITTVMNIKEEADNLAAILVPVFVVVAVVTIVVLVLRRRRRRSSAQNAEGAEAGEILLQTGTMHRQNSFRGQFSHLREQLETILHQMNDESGAFILMFLCKDKLNLREVEMQSGNPDLEEMLTRLENLVQISSRMRLAKSIRLFSGTFFTKEDITRFADPSIYDACACALFTLNPSVVLKYCHINFLRDNVRPGQHLETSTVDENQPIIYVSDVYTAIVDRRLGIDGHSEKLPKEEDCNAGVTSKVSGWIDRQLVETEEVFVETGIYLTVKTTLETEGHVTMSGAAGGGKTAIALMLGRHYEEERGFLQVHVADVSKFQLDVYFRELGHRSVCVIFHDIFRIIERSRDISVLKSVLHQLKERHLIDCKTKTQEHKLYTIFTVDTYSDHGGMSQLGDEGSYFVSGPSFLDLNEMSCQYTPEEKKLIFDKLCKGFDTTVDVEKICGINQFIVGFPLTCKLFAGFKRFQSHPEDFFQRPFHYLKEEINSILEREDDQSAALILMFLRDGPLNLHQVDLPSDNKELEDLFKTIKDVVQFTTRTAVAVAVRQFRGSFFTKGDITAFAHPTFYDACAIALYHDYRALVLRYASIRFLCEHVYTEETEHKPSETKIYVHKAYINELKKRLSKLGKEHPNYTALETLIGK